jgi:hypothetical protein
LSGEPIIVGKVVAIGFDKILEVNELDAVVPVPAFRAVTEIRMKERPSASLNL